MARNGDYIAWIITVYNIASRATQSNSVYVSVLQISTEHADGELWREQIALTEIFFSASGHCQRGENLVFRYNNGYKQRLGPLVRKQTQFSDLFSWARALKLAEKEINNGKGNSASASRFASLSEGSMQQILTERSDTLVKANKLQTGLFQPLKVSLSFSVLKLLNINLELSTEKLK